MTDVEDGRPSARSCCERVSFPQFAVRKASDALICAKVTGTSHKGGAGSSEVIVEVRAAKEIDAPDFTLIHAPDDDVLFVRQGVLSTRVICQLGVLLEPLRCPRHREARDDRKAVAG